MVQKNGHSEISPLKTPNKICKKWQNRPKRGQKSTKYDSSQVGLSCTAPPVSRALAGHYAGASSQLGPERKLVHKTQQSSPSKNAVKSQKCQWPPSPPPQKAKGQYNGHSKNRK